jgi:hypothetical protein
VDAGVELLGEVQALTIADEMTNAIPVRLKPDATYAAHVPDDATYAAHVPDDATYAAHVPDATCAAHFVSAFLFVAWALLYVVTAFRRTDPRTHPLISGRLL